MGETSRVKTTTDSKLRAALCVQLSNLVLPLDRETAREKNQMGSSDTGNLQATGAMGREDRGTEMVTVGTDPGGLGRVRSGSHCYTSEQGQGLCGHLGYPKSGIVQIKKVLTSLFRVLINYWLSRRPQCQHALPLALIRCHHFKVLNSNYSFGRSDVGLKVRTSC